MKQDESEYIKKIKSTMEENKESKKNIEEEKVFKKNKKLKGADVFYYLKLIFVLIIVIAVIYLVSLIIKRVLMIRGKVGEGGNIIVNQPIGPGKWVQVVYIGGKYLILGVTNERINLLSEVTDTKEIEKYETIINEQLIEKTGSFMDVVTDFFKTKIKKPGGRQKFDYEVDSIEFLKKQKERLDKIKDKEEF